MFKLVLEKAEEPEIKLPTSAGSLGEKKKKSPIIQGSYCLPNGHVQLQELDCKEGKRPKIDAFELWCWRRLLKVPWTERRSNQSILKGINPEYSLIGRTDAEAEAPVFCSSDANNQLIGKVPDTGED